MAVTTGPGSALEVRRTRSAQVATIAMVRACHPGPTVVVTSVATLLAVGSGRGAAGCTAVAAAVLAGQLSVGWCNDAVDATRDRSNARTGKPVVAGEVSARTVAMAAGAALLLVIPLSLLSGWRAAAAHLAAVALAWAYNLGMKGTRASILTYAGAFALLTAFVTLGHDGHPWPPGWVLAGGALLGGGAHLANALPDLEGDLATGVRGLPQRVGEDASRIGAAALLLAASVVLALGPTRTPGLASGEVAPAVVLCGLVLGSRRRPAWAFRAALALAAVDVLLLVAGGASL